MPARPRRSRGPVPENADLRAMLRQRQRSRPARRLPPPATVTSCPISMIPPRERQRAHPAGVPLPYSKPAARTQRGQSVAMHLLAALVTLLRLEAHRGDRARIEPLEADRLAGDLAIAVFAFLDPAQRAVDLGDQLALAVAGSATPARRSVSLAGAVGDVGNVARAVLKRLDGPAAFVEKVVLPRDQLAPEILELTLVHEWFVLGRTIVFGQEKFQPSMSLPQRRRRRDVRLAYCTPPAPRRPLTRPRAPLSRLYCVSDGRHLRDGGHGDAMGLIFMRIRAETPGFPAKVAARAAAMGPPFPPPRRKPLDQGGPVEEDRDDRPFSKAATAMSRPRT